MPKHKTRVEGRDKPRPTPDVQEKPEAPEKKAGPLPAPAMRAPEETTGAAGRARQMADMQQTAGNTRIGRMAGTAIQAKPEAGPAGDEYEQEADRTANAVMRMPVAETVENAETVPKDEGSPSQKALSEGQPEAQLKQPDTVMRMPERRIQRLRARGLVSAEVREIKRRLRWFRRQIDRLETERSITTEEAEGYKERIEALIRETDALSERREATRAEARRIWRRGRQLLRLARNVRRARRNLRRRAARGRSTRGLRLISNFRVSPPVIRVHEGEAARISFVLRRPARSIAWFILSHEGGGDVGTSIREFRVRNTEPGYKVAIWNGTWQGARNRPPPTGTYRVHLWVTGRDGNTEEVFDQIRIENPEGEVVHPRTGSGIALHSLVFDGSHAVLSDEAGNSIRMRAVSGLKRHHRLNREGRDYTRPRYQWVENRGPLPEGTYTIKKNTVQQPQLERGALRFPRGATARVWGPIRVPLHPYARRHRSGFFLHIDVGNDGTAGCIGIHPDDEGKFNNVMSLLSLMPGDLSVIVSYPGGESGSPGEERE